MIECVSPQEMEQKIKEEDEKENKIVMFDKIIEAFNEEIKTTFDGERAGFWQSDVVDKILTKWKENKSIINYSSRTYTFLAKNKENKIKSYWGTIIKYYEGAGWKVKYGTFDLDCFFTFTKNNKKP